MSKLNSHLIITDGITNDIVFEGSMEELLKITFNNVFYNTDIAITCGCFNFTFKI